MTAKKRVGWSTALHSTHSRSISCFLSYPWPHLEHSSGILKLSFFEYPVLSFSARLSLLCIKNCKDHILLLPVLFTKTFVLSLIVPLHIQFRTSGKQNSQIYFIILISEAMSYYMYN